MFIAHVHQNTLLAHEHDTFLTHVHDTLLAHVRDTFLTHVHDTLLAHVRDTFLSQVYDTFLTHVHDTFLSHVYDTLLAHVRDTLSVLVNKFSPQLLFIFQGSECLSCPQFRSSERSYGSFRPPSCKL